MGANSAPPVVELTRERMHPRGGCAAKLAAVELGELLADAYERVFGGSAVHPMVQPTDCAVLPLDGGGQLLTTVDLAPLVGLDLRRAGRIAALNALSDIYAVGGVGRWALVLLVLGPGLDRTESTEIMVGLLEACKADGVHVVGGHTLRGEESLAGLAAFGLPRSDRLLSKNGARPGDRLLISKPIGAGLVIRAFKLAVTGRDALDEAIALMTQSSEAASRAALDAQARAATDVSGFGLLGHLTEMLGDGLGARVSLKAVPTIGSLATVPVDAAHSAFVHANRDYVLARRPLTGITEFARLAPLVAPETNGGLLVVADGAGTDRLIESGFSDIGAVTDAAAIEIVE